MRCRTEERCQRKKVTLSGEYKAMHEEHFLSSWLREDGKEQGRKSNGGCVRKPNKRKDTTFYDTVCDAPRQTDKHGTSWRSDVPPPCLGGASHGWVPVNTHGTPVLTSVRRPWVAQPRPRAHASDTRRETRSANSKYADHPNMIVAQGW